ncbi:Extracytoplasmic solute receptor protein YiaO [Limihaloglobus sulfuriphilus]|uniref:Extracytoplasmic solute receptor protein YiaO n=1 Tax=Limihaloglobus sulfuriphilus TaxID=1851148 RepID=A0A1Q2MD98_9BACT|nr:TRAP transporter substrate-binding protein [Limihaloglobus sulfuriphilus]AQQ70287.1 Extracytoplasmic solute receptor protein YiaO [Limihaloglobus sulfuriphilus]
MIRFGNLAVLAALLAVYGAEARTLRLAHGLNTEHPVHKGMVYMARRVEEISDGKLKIKIYPSEQLGNEKECIEALQLGYLAMTKTSSATMELFVEDYCVLGVPYLFRDSEHFWKVAMGPIGKEILDSGISKRLKGLCYYDAGARSFYARKPILSPADLCRDGKVLKVRVQNSPMATEMVNVMGGAATPIPWGELYSALDQGVVDAAENNPPSLYVSRHYEICKYYCLDEHARVPDILVISSRVWNSLSGEEQKWLEQAADESVAHQKKLWAEFEEFSLKEVAKNGVEIIEVEKQPFIDSVKPIWEKYKDGRVGELIRRIVEVE